jgi:hypothetical protein
VIRASARERLWHLVADWEIAVRDAAADLQAAQARYDEAVACHATAVGDLGSSEHDDAERNQSFQSTSA